MTETATTSGGIPHLLYVADPMCSWCYGFSPVIGAVEHHFGARLPIRVMMGGLRAGNTRAMRPEDREYIRGAWARVSEATGQPFDMSFFDREHFVYDTEPACRSVVAVRRIAPERALAFKTAVSRAFYGGNRDTTNAEVLADIAAEQGFDRPAFAEVMLAPETRNETFRDFLLAQEAGVHGFPTLLASRGGPEYAVVTNGYRPLDGLIELLDSWLAHTAEA